ncbi:hypothetical protein BLNAU_2704 [Blattamonas nauphoetae]|uniref:Rap-GAP domain-containing protein n=1 Tax=Blattamonas nauphoetae TaxID=2049346 RepID=A0ABQ9YFC0_9EUKA|nr:hypothetical protein BLNAU_2704 [Blattamonas nauphoetae]
MSIFSRGTPQQQAQQKFEKYFDPSLPITKRYKNFMSFLHDLKDEGAQIIVKEKVQILIKNFAETIEQLEIACAKKPLSNSDLSEFYDSVRLLTLYAPNEQLKANLALYIRFLDGSLSFTSKQEARLGGFRILMILAQKLKGDFPQTGLFIGKSFNYSLLTTIQQESERLPTLNASAPHHYCHRVKPQQDDDSAEMLRFLMETIISDSGTFEWCCPRTLIEAIAPAFSEWSMTSALLPILFSNDNRIEIMINLYISILKVFVVPPKTDKLYEQKSAIYNSVLTFVVNWVKDCTKTKSNASFGIQIPVEEVERFSLFVGKSVVESIVDNQNNFSDAHLNHFNALRGSLIDCPHKLSVKSRNEFVELWMSAVEWMYNTLFPQQGPVSKGSAVHACTFTASAFFTLFKGFLHSFVKSVGEEKAVWDKLSDRLVQRIAERSEVLVAWREILVSLTSEVMSILRGDSPSNLEFTFLPSTCHCHRAAISRDAAGKVVGTGADKNAPSSSKLDKDWIPFFGHTVSDELTVKWIRVLYLFPKLHNMTKLSHKEYMVGLAQVVDKFVDSSNASANVMTFPIGTPNFVDPTQSLYVRSTHSSVTSRPNLSPVLTPQLCAIDASTLFNIIGPLLFSGSALPPQGFCDGVSVGLASIIHLICSSPSLINQHFLNESITTISRQFTTRQADTLVNLLPFLSKFLLYSPPLTLGILPLISSNLILPSFPSLDHINGLHALSIFATAGLVPSLFAHLVDSGLPSKTYTWGQSRTDIIAFCLNCALPSAQPSTVSQSNSAQSPETAFAAINCITLMAIDSIHQDPINSSMFSKLVSALTAILGTLTFITPSSNMATTDFVKLRSVIEAFHSISFCWRKGIEKEASICSSVLVTLSSTAEKLFTVLNSSIAKNPSLAATISFFLLFIFDLALDWICLLPGLLSSLEVMTPLFRILTKASQLETASAPTTRNTTSSASSGLRSIAFGQSSSRSTLSSSTSVSTLPVFSSTALGDSFHSLLKAGFPPSLKPFVETFSSLAPTLKVKLASTFTLLFLFSNTLEFTFIHDTDPDELDAQTTKVITFAQNHNIISLSPSTSPGVKNPVLPSPFGVTTRKEGDPNQSPSKLDSPASVQMTVRTPIGKHRWIVNEVLFDPAYKPEEEKEAMKKAENEYNKQRKDAIEKVKSDEADARLESDGPIPSSLDIPVGSMNPEQASDSANDQEVILPDPSSPAIFEKTAAMSPTPPLIQSSDKIKFDFSKLPSVTPLPSSQPFFLSDTKPDPVINNPMGSNTPVRDTEKDPLATVRFLLYELGILDPDIRRTWTQLEHSTGKETSARDTPLNKILQMLDELNGKKVSEVCVMYVGEAEDSAVPPRGLGLSDNEINILSSTSVSLPFADFVRAMTWQKQNEWIWETPTTVLKLHVVPFLKWESFEGRTTLGEDNRKKWERRLKELSERCSVCVIWDENESPLNLSFSSSFTSVITISPKPAEDSPCIYTVTPVWNELTPVERTKKANTFNFVPFVESHLDNMPAPVQASPFATSTLVPPHLLPILVRAACLNADRTISINGGHQPSIDHWILRMLIIVKAIETTQIEKNPQLYYANLFHC